MAEDCVLLLPLGETSFRAFLHTTSHCYEVSLILPSSGLLSDARLDGDWRLNNILRGQQELITQYMRENNGVRDFLSKLRDHISDLESSSSSSNLPSLPLSVCRHLAKDIDSLGWSRVHSVDTLFRHVKLTTKDKKERQHILTVLPTPDYPNGSPMVQVDAPIEFQPIWTKTVSLRDLLSQFVSWLDLLDPFWTALEELDSQTCILEPEKPTKSHTHRRILIGTHLSLLLHVDPHSPLCLPEQLQFLGPDQSVQALKEKVWRNSKIWNVHNSLLINLKALLGTEFPQPTARQVQEMSEECTCGICYDYRLNGLVPSVVCPNTHCAKCFHKECFNEWLQGLPRSDALNTARITGDCPFCGQVISLDRL